MSARAFTLTTPVRHRVFATPGASIHAVAAGPERGPAVILAHGFPETWWSWRHQIGPLADAGFHVVAVDLRGYGESSRAGPFDLVTLAEDLVAVARAVEPEPGAGVALVGHDWGGGAAWMAAQRHPDIVRRVAVMSCPLPHTLAERVVLQPRWSQVKRSWYMFFFQLPWVAEHLLVRENGRGVAGVIRHAARVLDHMTPDELAPFCEAAARPGGASAMLGVYRQAFRDVVADIVLQRRTIAEPAAPLEQDALLVWGMQDPALGYDDLVPGIERWVPKIRIERLDGVGHFPQSEAPELVARALLSFLRG